MYIDPSTESSQVSCVIIIFPSNGICVRSNEMMIVQNGLVVIIGTIHCEPKAVSLLQFHGVYKNCSYLFMMWEHHARIMMSLILLGRYVCCASLFYFKFLRVYLISLYSNAKMPIWNMDVYVMFFQRDYDRSWKICCRLPLLGSTTTIYYLCDDRK